MKTVAWIHGLNSSTRSFGYLVQQLPEHRSILIEYRSHQSLAASIAQVVAQLPPSEQVCIIGHSLGGVIAALIAADHPKLVERLVTISSPLHGSRAACTLRWIPGSLPVLNDIMPYSPDIERCIGLRLKVPTVSIISTGGHLPTSPEPNDSVVSVASQRALKFGKKVEIKASHFEILLDERTVKVLKDFVFAGEA